MRAVYDKRRKLMVDLMRAVGFGIPVMPKGAFYVFADVSKWTDNSYDSTNSFAVEFDTASEGGPSEGRGSPEFPRAWHVGIDGQNNVVSAAFTSDGLPDPFAPEGVHVRILYNRGRVKLLLGPGGGAGGALVQALEADLLPLSFAAPGEDAVFGFTASTGDFTQTAEVDNLTVERFGCGEKVPAIAGVPPGPVPAGSVVTLDGSGSHGGTGEDEPVSHSWSIVSGNAVIVGPADGPHGEPEAPRARGSPGGVDRGPDPLLEPLLHRGDDLRRDRHRQLEALRLLGRRRPGHLGPHHAPQLALPGRREAGLPRCLRLLGRRSDQHHRRHLRPQLPVPGRRAAARPLPRLRGIPVLRKRVCLEPIGAFQGISTSRPEKPRPGGRR
jgi:hypothetical protein